MVVLLSQWRRSSTVPTFPRVTAFTTGLGAVGMANLSLMPLNVALLPELFEPTITTTSLSANSMVVPSLNLTVLTHTLGSTYQPPGTSVHEPNCEREAS